MNRTAISHIFVWIFIVGAGGMLLVLFSFIAGSQLESGKELLSSQALQELDTIIATQQASPNTFSRIPIPAEKVLLTCRETRSGSFISQMEIGGFSRSLEHHLVVGADLETNELFLFSHELLLPFDIGNVLFLSSPSEVVSLQDVDDPLGPPTQRLEAFADILPRDVDVRVNEDSIGVIDAREITVRSVAVGTRPPSAGIPAFFRPQAPKNAVYLYVEFTDDNSDSGVVHLYEFAPSSLSISVLESYPFVGSEMAWAYIWQASANTQRGTSATASADRILCFQYKLQQRLSQQARLQAARLDALDSRTPMICSGRLSSTHVSSLDAPDEPREDYFSDLAFRIKQVELDNQELLRGARCGTIY